MYGIDLSNAYCQWRVREDQQELTAFWFLSELYVHCGLPFGSKLSPSVFCRFVHLIGRVLEEELGCVLNFYMDDATCMNFPRRVAEALGLLWDLREWMVAVRAKTLGFSPLGACRRRACVSTCMGHGPPWRPSR
jgi:hypothetical protein